MFAAAFRDVINLLYPPRCCCCSTDSCQPDADFCSTCAAVFDAAVSLPSCPRCAMPIPHGSACPYCQGNGIYPFQTIVALAPFRHSMRILVHQMKYHHRWPLAEILADRMLRDPRVKSLLAQTDRLIPIPLHFSRQIARGYNQADALTRRLSRRAGIRIARPILRLRNTPPQTFIHSREERAQNVRHAFGLLSPRAVRGQRITLVDDVTTTGATLGAAARALLPGDPAAINALVLAIADPRRRDFQTA